MNNKLYESWWMYYYLKGLVGDTGGLNENEIRKISGYIPLSSPVAEQIKSSFYMRKWTRDKEEKEKNENG